MEYSAHKDLSIDISITNVECDFSSSSQVKIQISNFLKKNNHFFLFPWCSTREDLSIDISITNVGLMLTWYTI